MIEQAEFEEWRGSFVGKYFFSEVRKMQDELRDALCSGQGVDPRSVEVTGIQTIDLRGRIEVLDQILNFKAGGE